MASMMNRIGRVYNYLLKLFTLNSQCASISWQIADLLHLSRTPYDKIGHFFQGLIPALVAREILIRGEYVRGKKMLAFIVVSIALAISAIYEFIEWGAALAMGQGADEFPGTQGDQWDTQSDMFIALIGAVTALLFFSGVQDRQIAGLEIAYPATTTAKNEKGIGPARTIHAGLRGRCLKTRMNSAWWRG